MPLPPALLARLKQRGIVQEAGRPSAGGEEQEEVFAESYDKDGEGGEEDERAGIYRGGAPGCPNKYNHYHTCSDYCFDHWQEGWPDNR